jgi:hypothetical protein
VENLATLVTIHDYIFLESGLLTGHFNSKLMCYKDTMDMSFVIPNNVVIAGKMTNCNVLYIRINDVNLLLGINVYILLKWMHDFIKSMQPMNDNKIHFFILIIQFIFLFL